MTMLGLALPPSSDDDAVSTTSAVNTLEPFNILENAVSMSALIISNKENDD